MDEELGLLRVEVAVLPCLDLKHTAKKLAVLVVNLSAPLVTGTHF